jgi:hypothetical protein
MKFNPTKLLAGEPDGRTHFSAEFEQPIRKVE